MRTRGRLLLSLASLAVAWLALEVWFGMRAPDSEGADNRGAPHSVYEPSPEQLQAWQRRLADLRVQAAAPRGAGGAIVNRFSARYGWANVPGTSGRHRDNTVSFNSIGARGSRELEERPPEGSLRVGCYGESFTFGTEVDDDGTWPAQLEVTASGTLEVVNLGVGGWGTDQAFLRFRDTVAELSPDVALMGLLTENIRRNVNRLRPAMSPGTQQPMVKPRFVLEEGELRLLPQPYETELAVYEAATDGRLGVDMAPHEWWGIQVEESSWSNVVDAVRARRKRKRARDWWQLWEETESEPFRVTVALLETFHREARTADARFAGVIVFPTSGDLDRAHLRPGALYAALEERDIPYLDVYDLLAARRARGETTYGKDHLTAEANGEVARAVLDWLEGELDL